MKLNKSPVTQHQFRNIPFFLKRDDLLHPFFSGNKARKLKPLLAYEDQNITHLIGYGSVQANSLLSLAALAKLKNWQLEFYVSRIPKWLETRPTGNYRQALSLGGVIIAVDEIYPHPIHPQDYILQHRLDESCLFIPEGGRSLIAESGVKELATELIDDIQKMQIENPIVVLPAGTGTTALYLHKYLKENQIEVFTCACVGGESYLISQFKSLGEQSFPTILSSRSKHHFGKLYQQDYEIWNCLLEETGIEFDLLYDPFMWQCIIEQYDYFQNKSMIYIHQGGIAGNESMLPRYQRKFIREC